MLASLLLAAAIVAGAPAEEPLPKPELTGYPFPMLVTSFGGGGALRGEGLSLGGDVMLGPLLEVQDLELRRPALVIFPMVGWSGWRGFERADPYVANAFVGRLDLGFYSNDALMGLAVSGAGRIGTAQLADARGITRGGHVGLVWWIYLHSFAVELQAHMNEVGGVWSYDDLRLVCSVNVSMVVAAALFGGFG